MELESAGEERQKRERIWDLDTDLMSSNKSFVKNKLGDIFTILII